VELSDGEEIMTLAFFVLTQFRRVTDRRTDVAIAITRASIASRGYQEGLADSELSVDMKKVNNDFS